MGFCGVFSQRHLLSLRRESEPVKNPKNQKKNRYISKTARLESLSGNWQGKAFCVASGVPPLFSSLIFNYFLILFFFIIGPYSFLCNYFPLNSSLSVLSLLPLFHSHQDNDQTSCNVKHVYLIKLRKEFKC